MKYLISLTAFLILLSSCEHNHGHGGHHGKEIELGDFKSEKVSKTATIVLNGSIENVFPLFNPVEEQKWAPVFKPHFIYPSDETIQEGMSFKTAGHGDESEFLWIITKYNKASHLIQYLVSTPNRYWTITISCEETSENSPKTSAKISYTYYALNGKGIKLNSDHLERIYSKGLKDWEEAINEFLNKQ